MKENTHHFSLKKSIFWLCYFLFLSNFQQISAEQNSVIGFQFKQNVKSVQIPIEIANNLILMPIRIDNIITINFILDTGSRITMLTEPLLTDFMNLQNVRTTYVHGLGQGDRIAAQVATGISMDFEGVVGHNISLLILPEGLLSFSEIFGKDVYGIIGYDILKSFVVEINYQKKLLTLHKPNTYQPKRKSESLNISIESGKPYLEAQVLEANNSITKLHLLLDTGATQALSLFDPKTGNPPKTIDTYLGKGLGGDIYGKIGRLKGFAFGNFKFENIIATYPDTSSIQFEIDETKWEGNIGAEIFKRFLIAFDYQNDRVFLRKNSDFDNKFFYNIIGLQILGTGKNYKEIMVNHVRLGSPADMQGLLIYDKILKIGFTNTYNLTIGEVYEALNRRVGKKVKLKIERNGKKISKIIPILPEI
ncbi:MAG: aspartyl protease family protein [Chitinophagales bacterium]